MRAQCSVGVRHQTSDHAQIGKPAEFAELRVAHRIRHIADIDGHVNGIADHAQQRRFRRQRPPPVGIRRDRAGDRCVIRPGHETLIAPYRVELRGRFGQARLKPPGVAPQMGDPVEIGVDQKIVPSHGAGDCHARRRHTTPRDAGPLTAEELGGYSSPSNRAVDR